MLNQLTLQDVGPAAKLEIDFSPRVNLIAKHDRRQELAYAWSNYRLACGYANTCKNEHPDVCDPASIQDGWFQLDLDTLGVCADPALPTTSRRDIEATITRLKLGEGRALAVRQHAMEHFRSGRAQLAFLEMDHPFLAKELVRRGIRTSAQLPSLPSHVTDAVEPELVADGKRPLGS